VEGEEQQNPKTSHTLNINKKISCENPSGLLGYWFWKSATGLLIWYDSATVFHFCDLF
jgi:hypothetical protein